MIISIRKPRGGFLQECILSCKNPPLCSMPFSKPLPLKAFRPFLPRRKKQKNSLGLFATLLCLYPETNFLLRDFFAKPLDILIVLLYHCISYLIQQIRKERANGLAF